MAKLLRSHLTGVWVFSILLVSSNLAHAQDNGQELLTHMANRLFDYAEWRYPEVFSSAESTQSIIGSSGAETEPWRWVYRYYPGSDTYLAVNEKEFAVYVYGPEFGPEVTLVGNLNDLMRLVGIEDPLVISGVWRFRLWPIANPTGEDCLNVYHKGLTGDWFIEISYDAESGHYAPNLGGLLSGTEPVDRLNWGFEISDNDEGFLTDASFSLTVHSPRSMTGLVTLTWDWGAWGNTCNMLYWTIDAVKQ